MITRRLFGAAMFAAASLTITLVQTAFAPTALAQVPPAQRDGGMGGASSAGGSSGGGMTADDEQAQGVEAGREGRTVPDRANARRGREAVDVDRTTDPRSPASGGVPRAPTTPVQPPR